MSKKTKSLGQNQLRIDAKLNKKKKQENLQSLRCRESMPLVRRDTSVLFDLDVLGQGNDAWLSELLVIVNRSLSVPAGDLLHDLLLTGNLSVVASDGVTVGLGLEDGLQVETGPNLFAVKLVAFVDTGNDLVESV